MTTILNNPAPVTTESNGSGFLIGAILLITFVGVLLYFGIPALRNMGPVQVNLPATQVVIPNKLDVNVSQTK
jgi:hypothetical protein